MADRQVSSGQQHRATRPSTTTTGGIFLRKLHEHAPNPTQLIGFLTLLISGGILLILTGITITVSVLGLIFLTPLLVISSPIWVPAATVLFIVAATFLSVFGFGLAVVAGLAWTYKYFRGLHPPGSDRVARIADTAREYGGYLKSKVKDAAPGA